MSILKRDEPTATIDDSQAATTTTTTSRTFTLPKIYTPLPSSHTTSTHEDPASYGITVFDAQPTSSTTSTTTHLDPKVTYLPPSFAPLATTTTQTHSSIPMETSSTTTTKSAPEAHSGLSGGQIAGIVIGSVFGGILALYILYVLCWNRRRRSTTIQVDSPSNGMEEKGKQQLYHVDDFDHELLGNDEDEQYNFVPYTDDQPIGLPRTQPQYNPQRVYSTTCIPNDPKEDFRSYYRTKSNPSSESSVSSDSSLQQRPYYGGFNPFYGPYMQPPAVIHGLGINTKESMSGASTPAVFMNRQFVTSPPPLQPTYNGTNSTPM